MLCVIAKIDNAARERLNELCKVVEGFDLPVRYLYGHITLVSYIGQNEADFIAQCKTALKTWRAFPVDYNCVELLPPTPSIVASPELSQELVAIHDLLLSVAPSEMDSWSAKEVWHPHTTLFYHTEADLPAIAERMRKIFATFTAEVVRIEFSRVTDSGYEIIDSITL